MICPRCGLSSDLMDGHLTLADCRRAAGARKSRTGEIWVLISFLQAFDGQPQFVSNATDHGGDVCTACWCDSPREAKQFSSRKSAKRFLGHLDEYDIHPINLTVFGFRG